MPTKLKVFDSRTVFIIIAAPSFTFGFPSFYSMCAYMPLHCVPLFGLESFSYELGVCCVLTLTRWHTTMT